MAVLTLRGSEQKCIRKYIIEFFRMDTKYRGHCILKDFVIDQENNEAYADIKTRDGWYTACLKFEAKFGSNIFPIEFALSKYGGEINVCI